jgi:hypothetical protein
MTESWREHDKGRLFPQPLTHALNGGQVDSMNAQIIYFFVETRSI